jgi:hypothetical protein
VLGLGVRVQCRCPEDDVSLGLVREQAPHTGTEDIIDGDLLIPGISFLDLSCLSTEESASAEKVSEYQTYLIDDYHNDVLWQI